MILTESVVRPVLAASLAVYGILCFGIRAFIHWKKTGESGFTLGKGDNTYGFVTRWFKLTIVFVTLYITLYAFGVKEVESIAPLLFRADGLRSFGLGIIWIATLLCFIAQLNMKDSWRVGIDKKQRTELVSTGFFRFSRNPIYLTMLISLGGLFLVLPNWISLWIVSIAYILIQVQVRLEEEHLSHLHGKSFASYRSQVRRWI